MTCPWNHKVEAYLDNELSEQDDLAFSQHLLSCHACTASAFGSRKLKLSVKRAASAAFVPSGEFQAKIRRAAAPRSRSSWLPMLAFASAAVVLIAALGLWLRPHQPEVFAEATDLHVSALASANPVDVISTDRHTVKPWFEGKLPFTFDLPELQNSEFHLIGGRMAYVAQSPGAQLLFGIRKHEISVFILQDQKRFVGLGSGPKTSQDLNFNLQTWTEQGLRYIVVSDTSATEVEALAKLLRSARQ